MQGHQGTEDGGDAGLVVQVARPDKAVGDLDAGIDIDVVADVYAQGSGRVFAAGSRVQPDLVVLRVALQLACLRPVDVGRGLDRENAAAHGLAAAGHHRAPLGLDGGPVVAADGGQHQPPAGLDLAHHRAQRVYVRGERTRVRFITGPRQDQAAFARAGGCEGQVGERLYHVGHGFVGISGRAGRVEQADQEVDGLGEGYVWECHSSLLCRCA